MNVVSLSTYDILGGAARSAWRLHCGLRQSGADATMLCRLKASEDPSVLAVSTPKQNSGSQMQRWANLADRLIHSNRSDRSGIFFTLPVPGCDLTCHPAVQAADVIHLHWVYSLLSPEGIQRLVNLGKPVVWTLHDQRPFTGGCHFSFGCEGYTGDCAGCPELRDNRAELTPWLLADARRALDPAPIVIVSPSRWLADCARRSTFLRGNRVEVIPYGLETNVFRPGDRAAARTALGLDATSLVLLFGADNTSEKRKGFAVLEEALVRCKDDPSFARALEDGRIKLLSFGKGSETGNACGLPIQSLGYVSKDEELARIFAASDLLVCPTLDDNLPNVILEARACGTPVLASRVGGVPELVTPDKNGDLVEPGDARALSDALLRVWREPVHLAQWNAHSQVNAGEGFGLEVQAARYLELYEELLRAPRQARLAAPAPADLLPLLPAQWPLSYRETDLGAAPGATTPTPPAAGTWEIRDANLFYAPEQGNPWRPSWGGENSSPFLSDAHEQIGKTALQWEGWPEESECRKIYEIAFHNGGVILESGCGRGRGAMVALLGALAGRPGGKPQFYGAVPDRAALEQCRAAAEKAGVAEHCLWYIGNAGQLLRDVPIVPTMVVIDGPQADAGALCHLHTLRWILAPGTVVLCRGYPDHAIVRQAVDDVLRTAHFEFLGLFAGSVLLRATGACRGTARGLAPETFATLRDQFSTRYMEPSRNGPPPVADLTAGLRGNLQAPARLEPGRGPWPFSAPPSRPLPATLPGGKPWPRITVVTPSFNQGQFLEETLLSVLNQGYPNLEYIVLDGGSTDQSVSLLNKYGPRLTFWASEKDRGQCHAINKGFARATGEILTWLNSDDRLAPGALAAAALAFHLSGADMVAGICELFQDGQLKNRHLTSCADGPLPLDRLLDQENCWEQGHFFYQPEVFFTRDLWNRAGGMLDEALYYSLDYELWLRFAKAGARLKVLGAPLAQYRMHEAQKTFYIEKFRPELRRVREMFKDGPAAPPTPPAFKAHKDRLRIALVNDVGFRYGAGIAHQRLAQALAAAGHELTGVAVAGHEVRDRDLARSLADRVLKSLRTQQPDLVLIGNLHAVSFESSLLHTIAEEWPTVFVAHDTWVFTGRCAYTGSCRKFLTGCDQTCPTPQEYPPLPPEEIRAAWTAKQQLLDLPGLVIAANSRWLLEKGATVLAALRAAGKPPKAGLRQVRYGLPLEVFHPRDPDLCRELLGLPRDKFLLFFCCTHVADTRKGTGHLVEALLRLRLPDLVPVCLGAGAEHLRGQLPDVIGIEYSTDPLRQAMIYSAADLFVAPSLEEAFGQVFIEAAACGTPSIAYRVDGVPEAVKDGVSGKLAAAPTPAALAAAISELYRQPQLRRDLGAWGALWARSEFSFEASYHTLFDSLREVLARREIRLSANLCFPPAPAALSSPEYLITPPPQPNPFQKQLERYYQQQLEDSREGPLPWVFNPRAWLARINRNSIRKHGVGRHAPSGL